jgi:hypothetical protein
MTWLVRILFGIDAAAALVIVYFFFVGLADGSVSSFNIVLWLTILASLAGILAGGAVLLAKGLRATAALLLAILAVPAFCFGLFVLAMIAMQPNWH